MTNDDLTKTPAAAAPSTGSGHFSSTGFAAALKPSEFDGANYKRWRTKMVLWLTAMNVFHVAKGKPEGTLTPEQKQAFEVADNLFKGAVVSVLGEKLVDAYMVFKTGKEMWNALEAKFGVSDAGSELHDYYHDVHYAMTNDDLTKTPAAAAPSTGSGLRRS